MPTSTISVTTDQNGAFSRRETFNPPGPFGVTVELKATLLTPSDTTVSGTVDVDATDGKPQNQEKKFDLTVGKQVSLGRWKLDGGENLVVVSGKTSPARPNTSVEIEIDASL